MPILIEEMTVQIEVSTQNNAGTNRENRPPAAGADDNPKATLIQACVEEVMEVIRHQNER